MAKVENLYEMAKKEAEKLLAEHKIDIKDVIMPHDSRALPTGVFKKYRLGISGGDLDDGYTITLTEVIAIRRIVVDRGHHVENVDL